MKVLKFGGSSVGSNEGRQSIKTIVEALDDQSIVVVSALGGVTDQLIALAKEATAGHEDECNSMIETIIARHHAAITDSVPAQLQGDVRNQIDKLFGELGNIIKGVILISDLSPKTMAAIVAYGERLSSVILAAMIDGGVHADAREIVKTQPYFARHIVDFTLTNSLIRERFTNNSDRVTVMGGFISADRTTGETTNLGRGGSDYTAAILAAALGAKELNIYTDVDGFMTADPRVIDGALLIDRLSFVEAMELCNFGAKVVYPPTIFPAYNADIPIIIRNTFNTKCKGTYISRTVETDHSVAHDGEKIIKGVSSINDTCLLTIRGLGMVGVIGVNYRIFKALSKAGISVFLVSQASSENSTSIGIRNADADLAVETLRTEFAQEIAMGEIDDCQVQKNLATVAIVGERMKDTPGVAGQLYGTLGRSGINIIAAAQGASQTNISFVTELKSLRKAINVLHSSFFLSEYRELNLYVVGVGFVGQNLLSQITGQQKLLMERNGLKINVVGVSNSSSTIFSADGLELKTYKEELASAKAIKTSVRDIFDKIVSENLFNSVFVDCTASGEVASLYEELLSHNVSVVTANKIAASGDYDHYASLKEMARSRGVKFLFETNVGAGLPIINTINDLRNSGDTILGLQAVVSGTLNYIFNALSDGTSFSQAVLAAREAGYAEPDPRVDLSGMDVIRKLVILARESGYKVETEDVETELFVTPELFEGSIDDFWRKLSQSDAVWEERRKQIAAEGKRWRFVAEMNEGKCRVSLQAVGVDHPFYNLEGSNNIILIHTARYREYPLQIKGYGAGANVTAAGVFADVMAIANIR